MAGKPASRVRGLSEAQFREAYGTEEQCRAVVEKLRWPEGFVCPSCGGTEGKWLSTRPKIQCRACRHQERRARPNGGAHVLPAGSTNDRTTHAGELSSKSCKWSTKGDGYVRRS